MFRASPKGGPSTKAKPKPADFTDLGRVSHVSRPEKLSSQHLGGTSSFPELDPEGGSLLRSGPWPEGEGRGARLGGPTRVRFLLHEAGFS